MPWFLQWLLYYIYKQLLKIIEILFTIKGKADRIDLLNTSQMRIIDYKTGKIPEIWKIQNGVEPQMILLGLIAHNNGFEKIPLKYLKCYNWLPFCLIQPKIKNFSIMVSIKYNLSLLEYLIFISSLYLVL